MAGRALGAGSVAPKLHAIQSVDASAVLCWTFAPVGIETL